MHALHTESLSVGYENQIVIKNLNLVIKKGKITVLIGPNGCGKSTLLKSMARILKPKQGQIWVDERALDTYTDKVIAKKLAFLPQEPHCPEGLSISELVAFGRYPHLRNNEQLHEHDHQIISWALDATGLTALKYKSVETLSGGQRQRAWIAMTLAQETDLILLDEPTTFLDMAYQLEVLDLVERLNREQAKTFVIVLHDLNLASRFAHEIIGLKDGVIICQGEPNDVINVQNLQRLYGIKAHLIKHPCLDYPICLSYEKFEE